MRWKLHQRPKQVFYPECGWRTESWEDSVELVGQAGKSG